MTPKAQTTTAYYWPLIILSDIHLGKKSSSADMLFEFLQHARCDTLILNGDIIDGWHLISKSHRKFPEMQKRVIDLLNARIADGMKIIYIPGNHDGASLAGVAQLIVEARNQLSARHIGASGGSMVVHVRFLVVSWAAVIPLR